MIDESSVKNNYIFKEINKIILFVIIIGFVFGCALPPIEYSVEINGKLYSTDDLSYLVLDKTTIIKSIGANKTNYGGGSSIWLLPGEIRIGTIYFKQLPDKVEIEYNRIKRTTKHEKSKFTQYITHTFKPGEKYFLGMRYSHHYPENSASPYILREFYDKLKCTTHGGYSFTSTNKCDRAERLIEKDEESGECNYIRHITRSNWAKKHEREQR